MKLSVRHYVYFDTPGIGRLFSQTCPYEERELVINETNKNSTSQTRAANPKLSGTVLAAGFEFAAQKEDNAQHEQGGERTQILFKPDEQKLLQLEERVRTSDNYIEISTTYDALAVPVSSLPAFCRLTQFPLIVNARSGSSAYEEALREQLILMEGLPAAESSAKLFVAAGLSKFDSTRKVQDTDEYHFGRTSHLAILLRQMAKEATTLHVFGHMRLVLGNIHVKPYAIWF